MTLRAWHAGALTAFPRYDEVVLAMRGRGINVLFMSPANLATFLERLPAGEHLPALERIYLAGSAAPSLLIEEARERLCRDVRTLYGATEVGPVACAAREALGKTPNAVGIVSRDVEVRCIDEQGSPQPHGIEANVRVRRHPGSGGYLDAASEPAFSGDWFYPGDIGSLSADGVLCLTGRTNEVVNVGGDKRSLPAIEEAVRALGERLEVAAFVIAGELGVPQLNVAVVEAPGLDIPALGTRCVDSGAVPPRTRFIGVAALPRNEFGKVMRDALAAAHGAGSGA
jgi:acyl-coenzyme A synthetase/AMP-(fatty) acid ligase